MMNQKVLPFPSNQPSYSELGKSSQYDLAYNPGRLFPILRAGKRLEIGIEAGVLPFYGFDCWNHYEVSWLDSRGKPEVAVAEISYDCHSPYLIESKSLKLYFNSLNQVRFPSLEAVEHLVRQDLERVLAAEVRVSIRRLQEIQSFSASVGFAGECIDDLPVICDRYLVYPDYLTTSDELVTERLYSNLLKSNCLVTNQPDWGSVLIEYTGRKIDREGLLRYLVSFRNHNEFHEQCIERIYMDLSKRCEPSSLLVYGRYTRRGGLDINPLRASSPISLDSYNRRLLRQ